MARGGTSKDKVTAALATAFPDNFLGVDSKKRLVLRFIEDGEEIDVCCALTCPKTLSTELVTSNEVKGEVGAFSTISTATKEDLEFTAAERKNVDNLLDSLGIDLSQF